MNIIVSRLQRSVSALGLLALAGTSTFLYAANPQNTIRATPRITGEISSSSTSQLPGSVRPQAEAQFDTGRLAASTRLEGVTLTFKRSAQQEASLQKLLAAQQDPSSAQYHRWLTPDQFAARYGVADADVAKVQSWLEQQGFAVDSVARSKTFIRFSGSVGQAEAAFATEIHQYAVPSSLGFQEHYSPATPLRVPSAMAAVVESVRNLDDFRPHPHFVKNMLARPRPHYTLSDNSAVYFAPGDLATVYDISPAYSAGNTGSGQNIVVVGQSAVFSGDIEAFQTAAGLPIKDPSIVLVPNSGTSTTYGGDESESDIDVEWAGAIAKGATITFVYTGNASNNGVWDSIAYAVDNKLGTVISSSYGLCEAELSGFTLESSFAQAAAQGQTVVSASGDNGATDCFTGQTGGSNSTTTVQQTNSVDYPASSPYVTGVGGTEISQSSSDYETPGKGYWQAANGASDILTSAIQYIPEQSWNEDQSNCGVIDCLAASGGGASSLFTKPTWQTGIAGIPSDGKRDVPDLALNASIYNPGYLYCTSDQSAWYTSGLYPQQASCNSGFFDSSSGYPTVAGGTSFAAPVFAGMVAIINQQQNYVSGQGLINPTLYSLASNATTYGSAFHDITSGNNTCPSGTNECSSAVTGFTADTGYDQVTGLGSVDLSNLVGAWPASTSTLIGTTTTIAASTTTPTVGANVTFAIAVASASGNTVPSGTVQINVDGTAAATLTLNNGSASYTTSFSTAGGHTITVAYSGDSTHAASTGSVTVTASAVSSGKGTFALSASNITVADGSVGTSPITITPSGGYTGTIQFSLTGSTATLNALNNTCPTLSNASVTGTTAVAQTLTIDTNAANCLATGSVRRAKRTIWASGFMTDGTGPAATGLAFSVMLLAGLLGRSSRKLRGMAGVCLLAVVGLVFTGCGGNGTTTLSNPAKGAYTLTLTGTDTATSITASTNFTLTIQ